jgi:hypothetical protein
MSLSQRREVMRKIKEFKEQGLTGGHIAAKLNMEGIKTGRGYPWTEQRIYQFTCNNGSLVRRRRKGLATTEEKKAYAIPTKIKTILGLGLSESLTVKALREVIG